MFGRDGLGDDDVGEESVRGGGDRGELGVVLSNALDRVQVELNRLGARKGRRGGWVSLSEGSVVKLRGQ